MDAASLTIKDSSIVLGQIWILLLFGIPCSSSEVRVGVECKETCVHSFGGEGLNWHNYPIKILITISMSFLHTGQGDLFFFSIFAHLKQATRWAVLPWTIFPSRGLWWHRKQGFSNFLILSKDWISSSFLCSVKCNKDSWLSHSCDKSKDSIELRGSTCGLVSTMYSSLGWPTGAEIVLRQSGTSIPSSSCLLWIPSMLDREREWTSLGQSEYQSFRKAQQR